MKAEIDSGPFALTGNIPRSRLNPFAPFNRRSGHGCIEGKAPEILRLGDSGHGFVDGQAIAFQGAPIVDRPVGSRLSSRGEI